MTSLIALTWKWLGGAWGCSSSNAQAAAVARGCFGYVRERVDARARVVFFGLFLPQAATPRAIMAPPRLRCGCVP
jgi:hypothetical protein